MIQSRILRATVVFLLVGSVVSPVKLHGADWKLFYKNDRVQCFYDSESMTYPSKDVVKVKVMQLGGRVFADGKVRNAKEILGMHEINCSKKIYRLLASDIYCEDGEQYKVDNTGVDWVDLPNLPNLEHEYIAVCRAKAESQMSPSGAGR
jgi:hypothetical protein